MNIIIDHVRILNFRSISCLDIKLKLMNLIIGANNSGKSNFLHALNIALNGSKSISEEDIYVSEGERLSKEKKAIIDIKFIPVDGFKRSESFSDFWTSVFTTNWIVTDDTEGDYVGIRTVIEFDTRKNDYTISRKPIKEWNDSIEASTVGRPTPFNRDMLDYISSFYMDALRDVTVDIKDRKSYFGKITSKINLTEEEVERLENQLDEVNNAIINNISAISDTKDNISKIGKTMGNTDSAVQIEPISRRLSDLHKGMDISFKDGRAAAFSVSRHGMGTKSWISFLTLGAYVNYYHNSITEEDSGSDDYALLTMEEPEAHLHPQAQRQIYLQLKEFDGQKVVSTHSSEILAQAELGDIIRFTKIDGTTHIKQFDESKFDDAEIEKIRREVIRTHGDLIFSSMVILCEGITEEQALPIYFKEFFDTETISVGINIIGIGGKNYKSYLMFADELDMQWCIFSDGEKDAIKTVEKAVKNISDTKLDEFENVFIIDNGYDFEKMLIKSNNSNEIIDGINSVNGSNNYYERYVKNLNGKMPTHRRKTDQPPCPMCGQDIFEEYEDEYPDLNDEEKCLYRCMISGDGKAKYAGEIANRIVSRKEKELRFPSTILSLLLYLEKTMFLKRKDIYNGLEFVKYTNGNS